MPFTYILRHSRLTSSLYPRVGLIFINELPTAIHTNMMSVFLFDVPSLGCELIYTQGIAWYVHQISSFNYATPRNCISTQNASSPRRTQTTTSRRRVDTLPPRRTGDRQRPTTQQASSQTRLRQSLRRQRPTSNRATPASQTALRQSITPITPKSATCG